MVFTIAAPGFHSLLANEPDQVEEQFNTPRIAPLQEMAQREGGLVLPPLPSRDSYDPLPGASPTLAPARATARFAYRWTEGDEQVVILRDGCTIQDGAAVLMAEEMVIWTNLADPQASPTLFLSGQARVEQAGQSRSEPALLTRLEASSIAYDVPGGFIDQPQRDDPLFRRATTRRELNADAVMRSASRPAVVTDLAQAPGAGGPALGMNEDQGEIRRVRIFPRSGVPFNIDSIQSTNTMPPEQVTVLSGGVNVLIDSVNRDVGVVDLRADQVVIWTQTFNTGFETEQTQSKDTPFTIYLEGNIVMLQGDRIVHANRAVYDATVDRALMEQAELRAFIPEMQSDIRVRANQLRQLSRGRFHAFDTWSTTSVFGKPGYRMQSRELFLEQRYDVNLQWLGAGTTVVDPATGMEMVETNWLRSYDNTVFIRDMPIMYSPYVAGPAEEIKIPLKQLSFGHDNTFGFYGQTAWDPFQLFGLEEPPGVELYMLADYYSKRGPGLGARGKYQGEDLFGLDDNFRGEGIGYYVHDDGLDRLGRDRIDLPISTENRWRFNWRHRHNLPGHVRVNAEAGVLSDRNMLEQYFESEFDSGKDHENLLYATQSFHDWGAGHWGWELLGQAPLNDFETVTGWYPKADLWGLSEPLFDGWLTWSSHSLAGYGDLRPADPDDYRDELHFTPLPYAPDVDGATFMTRHQLDLPLPVGPVKIVPFAMGEAAFWQSDMQGDEAGRLTGSVGARSSVQFERIFPGVYNRALGLNGLAHKIRLEGEYRLTETSESMSRIAQYTDLDDNAQERMRYRIPGAYFHGSLPVELDPRFYGVRRGIGTDLGSPYYELIEDQQVIRLAARQRLQTKSGPPGMLRIRDWMTFDTGLSLFPNSDRDNFGETVGLMFADYSWMVSEHTRFLADVQWDLFDNASNLWNLGFQTHRTRRGSLYMGIRHLEFADVKSDILIGSYTYVMSPKWMATLSAALDVKDTENTTQTATLTRVGADFLIHVGVENNSATENVGVNLAIEPRFGNFRSGSTTHLSSMVPPPINP